jgi:hypothetical protein
MIEDDDEELLDEISDSMEFSGAKRSGSRRAARSRSVAAMLHQAYKERGNVNGVGTKNQQLKFLMQQEKRDARDNLRGERRERQMQRGMHVPGATIAELTENMLRSKGLHPDQRQAEAVPTEISSAPAPANLGGAISNLRVGQAFDVLDKKGMEEEEAPDLLSALQRYAAQMVP